MPAEWVAGVAHAPAPVQAADELAQLKAWIGFATGEAANVEMANARTKDALGIVARCERRDALAVNKVARRKVLGIF